jgi:hypothetical protein
MTTPIPPQSASTFQPYEATDSTYVWSKTQPEKVPFTIQGPVSYVKAFHTLINYWEMKPSQYESKLQELAMLDITEVGAFIPWAHLETDIYHSLKKFVRAAIGYKMRVRLYVMPELGVNYPYSGLPRELLENHNNQAIDGSGQVIYNTAAPNIFPLPSFLAPEVVKRFGNYLIKVAGVLSEIANETSEAHLCEVVIGDGLFNYYRSFQSKPVDHGDYSAAHVMAFRDFLDKEYSAEGSATFKRQVYEVYNRHLFFAHMEQLLREKTEMIFSKKNPKLRISFEDILNPECVPELNQHALFAEVTNMKCSTKRFYDEIAEAGSRNENIYLNHAGIFRKFTEQEKSFLVLSSLIHSGIAALSSDDVMSFSDSFRKKIGQLLTAMKLGEYQNLRKLRYVSASKYFKNEECYNCLKRMAQGVLTVGCGLTQRRSDRTSEESRFHERLIFIDPSMIIKPVDFLKALSLAQSGKVVAIPAPFEKVTNYETVALNHYQQFKRGRQSLKINIGLFYEVFEYHLGKVVFYDSSSFWSSSVHTGSDALSLFFKALLGLAEIAPICLVNNQRLHVICHVSRVDPSDKLLFLINPESEVITAKLTFECDVGLSALPQETSNNIQAESWMIGKNFELQVPPKGILSMAYSDNIAGGGQRVWT